MNPNYLGEKYRVGGPREVHCRKGKARVGIRRLMRHVSPECPLALIYGGITADMTQTAWA